MLEFTRSVEHFGRKFDRGMILWEFDALREPEKTRFPQIGAWVKERCAMVEIPTPSMLWRGTLWPDLYIANQLDAVPEGFGAIGKRGQINKEKFNDETRLDTVSIENHGVQFHAAFIEPMCRKITGRSTRAIAAKYHRAAWLPLYWPKTLRSRQSIRTPFYYPAAGYAGAVAHILGDSGEARRGNERDTSAVEAEKISIAFVVAAPRQSFSVAFIVDDSPIYRITDQDTCAGLTPEFHRYVVEYRGECNVVQELERLGLTYHARHIAFDSVRLTLPTIATVQAGWKPRPTINDQLWEHINAKTSA